MNKMIVAVDMGHFKAYSVTQKSMESPRVKLIESYDAIEAHGKVSEKYSDKTGRFGSLGSRNGTMTGSGEPHNTKLETSKKVVKLMAKDINSLIMKGDCEGWYLAATKKINNQILEYLDPAVKAKLEKNILLDLTGADKSALLQHFE